MLMRYRCWFSPQCPVRRRTNVATVCLLDIALYSFVLALTPLRLVMCLSVVTGFVFPFHSFSHWIFALSLMVLAVADLSGLCLYWRLSVGSVAALLTSRSALSFPSISQCLGTQVIVIRTYGRSRMTVSMLSSISLMIACPDCVRGLFIAFIAAWLSEYTRQLLRFLSCSMFVASCSAASSPAYTLNCLSFPRCWCLPWSDVVLYAAAPILPLIPEPSV